MFERIVNYGLTSYRFTDDAELTTQQKTEIIFNRLYKFFYEPINGSSSMFVDKESLKKTYYLKGQLFFNYTIEESKEYFLHDLIQKTELETLALEQGRVLEVESVNLANFGKFNVLAPLTFAFTPFSSNILGDLMWSTLSTIKITGIDGDATLSSYSIMYSDGFCQIRGF